MERLLASCWWVGVLAAQYSWGSLGKAQELEGVVQPAVRREKGAGGTGRGGPIC